MYGIMELVLFQAFIVGFSREESRAVIVLETFFLHSSLGLHHMHRTRRRVVFRIQTDLRRGTLTGGSRYDILMGTRFRYSFNKESLHYCLLGTVYNVQHVSRRTKARYARAASARRLSDTCCKTPVPA